MVRHAAAGKKCWNGFGIGQPAAGKKVSIAAEINFPTEGLNRAVSGVFAEDNDGGVWVLHRGKIRGGKELFFRHFGGETLTADDDGKEETFALVDGWTIRISRPNWRRL